jgi:hypothetical protein
MSPNLGPHCRSGVMFALNKLHDRPEANICRPCFFRSFPHVFRDKMYRPIIPSLAAKQLSTALRPGAVRASAFAHSTPQSFNWEDPLGSQNLLTEEELAVAETAESYCQERMLPRVLGRYAYRIMFSICANGVFHRQMRTETSIMTRRSLRKWAS